MIFFPYVGSVRFVVSECEKKHKHICPRCPKKKKGLAKKKQCDQETFFCLWLFLSARPFFFWSAKTECQ